MFISKNLSSWRRHEYKVVILFDLKKDCSFLQILFTLFFFKLVVCILLRVLGQVQGFRLTQH
jgi:hypothetical protein